MALFFEFIFEFLFECLFEGSVAICKNKKISRWIRYPLFCLLLVFVAAVIGFVFLAGIVAWKENIWAGLVFLLVGIFFIIGCLMYVFRRK